MVERLSRLRFLSQQGSVLTIIGNLPFLSDHYWQTSRLGLHSRFSQQPTWRRQPNVMTRAIHQNAGNIKAMVLSHWHASHAGVVVPVVQRA